MTLDFATYKDKVMGCWAGKNIGGVLGVPFECKRQLNDIDFYTQYRSTAISQTSCKSRSSFGGGPFDKSY